MTTVFATVCLALGVAFAPAASVGALSESQGEGKKLTSEPTIPMPPMSRADSVSMLYSDGIMASLLDTLPDKALEKFLQALDLDTLHGPSLYEVAEILFNNRQTVIAQSYIERAVATDTLSAEYLNSMARIYIVNSKYEQAIDIYEKLVELTPNDPTAHQRLGSLYIYAQQPYIALSVLDKAQERFGKRPEFSMLKRDVYASINMLDKAIEESLDMAETASYDIDNLIILAELYAQQGRDSLAIVSYDRASAEAPDNVNIELSKCDFYINRGNNEEFLRSMYRVMQSDNMSLNQKIELFNAYVKKRELYAQHYLIINNIASSIATQYPDDNRATDLYTNHLISTGDIEIALEIYKNRLKAGDHSIDTYNTILDIEAYQGRVDSVERYSLLAIEKHPKNPNLYMSHSNILHYTQQYSQAEKALKQALKYSDSDSLRSVIYCSLGDIQQSLGRDKKGITYYKKSLEYDGSNSMTLNNYSYLLSTIDQDLELALNMSEISNQLSKNNPIFLDTHAWVLYKLGRYEQAQNIMRMAISLDTDGNAELFVHYGDILYALDSRFMAIIYWRKALESGYDADEINRRIKESEEGR